MLTVYDAAMAKRRDYPLSFFWGVLLMFGLVGAALTDATLEPGTRIFGAIFGLAVGGWLVYRGYQIAESRPRKG